MRARSNRVCGTLRGACSTFGGWLATAAARFVAQENLEHLRIGQGLPKPLGPDSGEYPDAALLIIVGQRLSSRSSGLAGPMATRPALDRPDRDRARWRLRPARAGRRPIADPSIPRSPAPLARRTLVAPRAPPLPAPDGLLDAETTDGLTAP